MEKVSNILTASFSYTKNVFYINKILMPEGLGEYTHCSDVTLNSITI